jgi:hypothetical protein
MASRLNLHEELCALLLTRNVYFNPPESVKLKYPCIVYSRSGIDKINADNRPYKSTNRYTVTTIDSDPDSKLPDLIIEHFPMCSFDRAFVSENLNHNVFTLYY